MPDTPSRESVVLGGDHYGDAADVYGSCSCGETRRHHHGTMTYDCPDCEFVATFQPNTVGHYDAIDHILAHANGGYE